MRNREKLHPCRNGYPDLLKRREFFRRVSSAALGALAAGTVTPSARAQEYNSVSGLPTGTLGRTGLKVTSLGYGGIAITDPAVLVRAIEAGLNLAHIAPDYQNGRSIEAFGRAMKTHRKGVILALKERPENIDKALQALNTDFIDLLLPPVDSPELLADPRMAESFQQAKKAGKCGFLGFACHSRMTEVMEAARNYDYFDVALISYANTQDPYFHTALRKLSQAGMGILAMKGLPHRKGEVFTEKEIALAGSLCRTMVQRWCASSVLVTIENLQALAAYRRIMETEFSFAEPELENRYFAERALTDCSMCGRCSGVCPRGVEISRVLRYRAYHADYRLADYARSRYASLSVVPDPQQCAGCRQCEAVCSRRLPLADLLIDAHSRLA